MTLSSGSPVRRREVLTTSSLHSAVTASVLLFEVVTASVLLFEAVTASVLLFECIDVNAKANICLFRGRHNNVSVNDLWHLPN
jgi:hypothetical protein